MRHVRRVAIATVRRPCLSAGVHDMRLRLYADVHALVEDCPKMHVLELQLVGLRTACTRRST